MRKALILACAAALSAPGPALPADPAVAKGLVRNAWYWQARARDDKAEDAWKAVLAADPDNAEALAAMAGFHARAGRGGEAREALAHLERMNPGHPDVPVVRRQLELGPRLGPALAAARKLVHEGKVPEGVARYRELFGAAGPPGDLALEYYQTLSGTPGGWAEARDGLTRLVRRAPSEVRFRLGLAKLLTYRDETRREGIRMLAELSRDRTVAKEATASWRQALLWLAVTPSDAPLLRAYLKAHPGDAEVARHVESGRQAGVVKEGYAALDRGDLREAERLFLAAGDLPEARRGLGLVAQRETQLRRKAGFDALERGDLAGAERLFKAGGDDADARLGLAIVAQREALAAQREEDLPRARELLERARKLAPAHRELWEAPLRSVTFWGLLQEARAAREARRDGVAEAKLFEALDRAPEADRWHAELALGDLYAARKDARAEAHYREVLSAVPEQPSALRGLAGLLVASGRFDEALAVNERLARADPAHAYGAGWLRAESHRAKASARHAANDLAAARAELETARRDDPADPWVLHDLANLLLETGAVADARPVVADLARVAPQLPEARVVEARLLAADGEDAKALALLARVPAARTDPSLVALRRRLEVRVRVPAILERARTGDAAGSAGELVALERQVDDEPQLAGSVALAWAKLGERDRAVALMRRAMAKAPGATRSMRLELASTLLEAGDDDGVATIVAGLERDPSLRPDERRWLADLRIARAVRLADRSRERGDARGAAAALEPVRRDYPEDPRVVGALARSLERRDPGAAHALYLRVLAASPDDPDARRGAIDTALAAGDADEARALATEGARRQPDDARAHVLLARAALRSGDDAAAMRSLERAWALASAPASTAALAPGAGAAALPEGAAQRAALAGAGPDGPALRAEIGREMDRLRDRHRAGLDLALEARQRSGEAGLGQLVELRQSLALDVPIALRGQLTFRATEVELDAGALDAGTAARFGTGGGGAVAGQFPQVTGTGLSLTYADRDLEADVGTTPLGFPVQAILGGLRLRHDFGALRVEVAGARRSVTESVLSYAGVKDPATGRYWGGVVSEGGRLDLAVAPEPLRVFAYGGYDRLVGYRVAENRRLLGGAGVEVKVLRGRAGELVAGVEGLGMAFDQNLRFFTFGQGGYFSPQRFVRGSLPVGYRRGGAFRVEIVAAPGIESFEEAASPALPDVSGAAAAALRSGGPAPRAALADYPGQIVSGYTFDGHAALGWSFAGAFDASLAVAAQRAPEFQEVRGMFTLRYGGSAPR
jgi:cellulose synthase operon protein C